LGEATIDGLLDLVPAEDSASGPGDEFVIIAARRVSGVFQNAAGSILVGDYRMEVAYGETDVILRTIARVPEPPTLALLSLLLSGLLLTSRYFQP
jgi:hypothetical protein